MGKLFVIDGLDGCGKATQTELLYNELLSQGYDVRSVAFPDYDSLSSGPVRMYLAGELSENADDVNAFAASSFFSVDRYCRYMRDFKEFYDRGGILICDRYTTANAIHQCTKLPPEEHDLFVDWLFDFEYNKLGIPKPDEVIFLSLPVKLSSELMDQRYAVQGGRDIHEKDDAHQHSAHRIAKQMAQRLCWREVKCDVEGAMRSREDIAKEIYGIVQEKL